MTDLKTGGGGATYKKIDPSLGAYNISNVVGPVAVDPSAGQGKHKIGVWPIVIAVVLSILAATALGVLILALYVARKRRAEAQRYAT